MSASATMSTTTEDLYIFSKTNLRMVSLERRIFVVSGLIAIEESWHILVLMFLKR
jgi:hypothetical protein